MAACAATFEVVYAPAPAALPVASKAQRCRPSLRPAAPSLRRLLRPLLFWLERLCLVEIREEALARKKLGAAAHRHDAAPVDLQDPVCVLDCGQAVGDDDGCASGPGLIDGNAHFADLACAGLEQANGAALPAISPLLLPTPLGGAAAIALDWGVQGVGSSVKESCRLAGQAERYGIAGCYGT